MSFPKELLELKQWVCWRLTPGQNGEKDRKVPFDPKTCKPASTNKPATWSDYNTAHAAQEKYGFTGLGFVFVKDCGIVGVDIDNCYDPESRAFNEVARAILAKQPTYAEFSPSGKGVHLFLKGSLPAGGCKNSSLGLELYDHVRYFTMTGNTLDRAPDTISADGGVIAWILNTYFQKPKPAKKKRAGVKPAEPLNDDELLQKAKGAKEGGAFTDLWEGRWQGKYESQSEADSALCCHLAFWSGKNREQMDRLFRRSALFRDKWDAKHHADGATYGEETLNNAIDITESTYGAVSESFAFEQDGRYYSNRSGKVYPITNFVFQPIEMITAEDDAQMTADLVTLRGESFRLTFMTSDFANQQRFKNCLNRRTISLGYFGSDADLELLKGYIAELAWHKKTGVKAVGIHKHEGKLAFVGHSGAISAGSATVSDIVQLEKWRGIDTAILDKAQLPPEQLPALGKLLMEYNEPAKTVSILAWTAGCFIKEHLRMSGVKFPHLMLIGEAGSGKSNTLERVILPVFSRSKVIAAGQVTAFTLMKDSASSNLVPQALDEFKPSKIDRFRLNTLYNHFRNAYDGLEGLRGKADQTTVSYELLAPLVVAGEESADEAAIRERSIELLFSKKDLKSVEYRLNFHKLAASSQQLGCLGRSLLETALQTTPDDVLTWHREGITSFVKELPSRVLNNLACCHTGLCLLERLCAEFGYSWHEVFPYSREVCAKYLEFAAREYLLDGGTSNRSVLEQTFEIMARMRLDPKSEFDLSPDGKILALRLNLVYDRYTRYRKDYAIAGETLSYSQFKKQLLHSDFFLESNAQKRIGADNCRVWTVDYEVLKSRCDVSGFEITEAEPL